MILIYNFNLGHSTIYFSTLIYLLTKRLHQLCTYHSSIFQNPKVPKDIQISNIKLILDLKLFYDAEHIFMIFIF